MKKYSSLIVLYEAVQLSQNLLKNCIYSIVYSCPLCRRLINCKLVGLCLIGKGKYAAWYSFESIFVYGVKISSCASTVYWKKIFFCHSMILWQNQLTVNMRVYFCTPNLIPLTCIFILIPVLYCTEYCRSVVSLKLGNMSYSSGLSGLFWVPSNSCKFRIKL